MNSMAVRPLTSTPMAATTITVQPATGSGACRRCTASTASAPSRKSATGRWRGRPGWRRASSHAGAPVGRAQAAGEGRAPGGISPATSERLCPASASSASEPTASHIPLDDDETHVEGDAQREGPVPASPAHDEAWCWW